MTRKKIKIHVNTKLVRRKLNYNEVKREILSLEIVMKLSKSKMKNIMSVGIIVPFIIDFKKILSRIKNLSLYRERQNNHKNRYSIPKM